MPPPNTPLPSLPCPSVGRGRRGADSPQLAPSIPVCSRCVQRGRRRGSGSTGSCTLPSASLSPGSCVHHPLGSPAALLHLHAFFFSLPNSGGHQNPGASRRHRGLVARLGRSQRLHHILLPPVLLLPTRFISLGGWKEQGDQCTRGLGFHRSEPLTFSAMLGSPAKWEPGQHFFCRFLQDMPGQLWRC